MELWILLGLTFGLAFLGWHWFQLNLKLRHLVQSLRPDTLVVPFSSTSRLTRAIAAHKRAHEALQEELRMVRQLFEMAPIGFLQVDEDNQLLSCNPKAFDLLGIEPQQLVRPRLLLELVRSYELDALIEQTRQAQEPCNREWVFHLVDADYTKLSQQQPRPLRGYGFPMSHGCVGVFLESREEAVLLAQQRDRWISDVAHELKTPLTSIRLVAETLQSRLAPPIRDWVDRLLQETIRLSNLVQDLLDLNQLQAQPSARLSLKTVDLPRLIQSAWDCLEPLAREKQIQLDYIGPEDLRLQADEARLHRVLLNLLDNSVKYSPVHQRVQVRLELTAPNSQFSAQQVHLEVIDAGPGFPENALPHLFERFYRVDPSRTRTLPGLSLSSTELSNSASGTTYRYTAADLRQGTPGSSTSSSSGLGLAIVRQIVESHQGTVTASNHPETGGAWLQVWLPWQPPDEDNGISPISKMVG